MREDPLESKRVRIGARLPHEPVIPAHSPTFDVAEDTIFVGGYPSGYLLEWKPSEPWVATDKEKKDTNPQFHMQVTPTIHRPHALLPLPDESMIIMGGTPAYGYTGGGLLFWDRQETTGTVVEDKDIVPDQSSHALIDLPGGKILGGTTTAPGTGGEKMHVDEAEGQPVRRRPMRIGEVVDALLGVAALEERLLPGGEEGMPAVAADLGDGRE